MRVVLMLVTILLALPATALEPLAPGYAKLPYQVPAPGSYRLPPIKPAGDGPVIDAMSGKTMALHQALGNRYALLAFFYSHCDDVNGCPLSMFVFHQLQAKLAKDPELARNLRLVSLSFDPARDTPEALRAYAMNMGGMGKMHQEQGTAASTHDHAMGSGPWRFLTTSGEKTLAPLLAAYGQEIQRSLSTPGKNSGDISHVLRVFLIDPQKRIRNIYSTSFLHSDLILADLRTLLQEERAQAKNATGGALANRASLGPGDDKQGYEADSYRTHSRALHKSAGKTVDLLQFALRPPLGLPPLPQREKLRLNRASVALGRKLFFDRRLSLNNTISCAMCHVPEQGFTSNEMATAVGIEGRTVRRNAPTVLNAAYNELLFHDGRENRLSQQVWGPLLAKNEMGNPSVGFVLDKLRSLPDYAGLFEKAFDGEAPNMLNLGEALAAYQMTLNAAASPFDRWHFGGEEQAVDDKVKQGFALFTGKAGCSQCHLIEADHALFTDQQLHNTGIGYRASLPEPKQKEQVQLAPGVFVEVPEEIIAQVSEPPPADLGRYEITQDPADRWKFKTPSLRNLALTAPYMHDGSLRSLREVVAFYNRGGAPNPLLDPRLHPLGLTDDEMNALVAFLESLTGGNLPTLVTDALAAPVGDVRHSSTTLAEHPRTAISPD